MKYVCVYHDAAAAQGAFPQIIQLQKDHKLSSENSIKEINKSLNAEINGPLDLNFELAKGARLTDVLSTVYFGERTGLVVSENLLTIFKNYSLPAHQIFPASIKTGNNFADYYYLHFAANLDGLLDFTSSLFRHNDPKLGINDTLRIQNDAMYNSMVNEMSILGVINVTTAKLIHAKYDLVNLSYLLGGILMSEKLYRILQENGVTGLSVFKGIEADSTE